MVGQHRNHSNIVSGESASEEEGIDNENMFSFDDDEREGRARTEPELEPGAYKNQDFLYDANLDEEDEAYVYKNLRGGITEPITMLNDRPKATTNTNSHPKDHDDDGKDLENSECNNNNSTQREYQTPKNMLHHSRQSQNENQNPSRRLRQVVQVYKPRSSDAVLSCPCCFNIVCMDCQRHKRYVNQFRAMFVMGVVVDWNNILVYDDDQQTLVAKIVDNQQDNEYYSVECATCRTQVGALDMTDEVYHFFGCIFD